MPTRLVLVRHGQTPWNATRRWQGHTDVPHSELGREQAREAAAALARESFTALYSSDLQRAFETARIIGEPHDLSPQPDPRLRELHVGEWEGLTRVEIQARWPELLESFDGEDEHARPTGGETRVELAARVHAALDELCARHDEGARVIVVAHGGVLGAVLGTYGHANGEAVPCDWPPDGRR